MNQIIIPPTPGLDREVSVDSKIKLKFSVNPSGKIIIIVSDAVSRKVFFTVNSRTDNSFDNCVALSLKDENPNDGVCLIHIGDVRVYVSNYSMADGKKYASDDNYYINVRKGCGKTEEYVIPADSISKTVF